MTDDERAQAYEDAYWAEWDGRESVIERVVSTWDATTEELFLKAVEQAGQTRAEERGEVRDALEPIGFDGHGAPIYSWQI